jgi:galactokinase
LPPERLTVSAPGRLCLFGEHQDFLGLPVIALAVNVLRREGLRCRYGYDITVRGTVPINAGCGSSSAMLNAWIAFLAASQDGAFPRDPVTVARLAHRAEVIEFNEPGGMMDHYTSTLGGLLHIKTEGEIECTRLPARLEGFVLGDSLTPKDTTTTLARSRQAMARAVAIARQEIGGFSIHTTSVEEARRIFPRLEQRGQEMLEGNLINRDLCRKAHDLLQQEAPDANELGRLLLAHHEQLSRNIQVSTAKVDRMVEASMGAGALGAKINGSGGGGCMFAFAPGREREVAAAIEQAGGKAHLVRSHPGLTVTAE